jgi:type I restriction enzyme S subunit
MVHEWRKCRWGDLVSLEYGKGLRGYEDSDGPYLVFGTNGPIGKHSVPLCNHPGVIIGRKGAYRGVHYSDRPFFVIDTAFYLEPKEDIDLKWAYYELLTNDINSMDSGSAIPSTSRDAFYSLPVTVPPPQVQHSIAHVLGTLDDKIELNRQMNKTLESLARAIFKSWFVDFDPVYSKSEGRQPFGMDAETAALFPASFEKSTLGKVPEGWNIGVINDLGDIICGKTPPTSDESNYGNEIPFITIPDMHGKIFITQTARYLSSKGAETQPTKTVPSHSICVSCIASPGIVSITSQPSQTNQQINTVVPEVKNTTFFCYWVLRELADEIRARGSGGSVTLNLNKTQFSLLPTLLPPRELMSGYHKMVEPLFEKILSNEKQTFTLHAIREALLPKLLSGEIRVKEAEKYAETLL